MKLLITTTGSPHSQQRKSPSPTAIKFLQNSQTAILFLLPINISFILNLNQIKPRCNSDSSYKQISLSEDFPIKNIQKNHRLIPAHQLPHQNNILMKYSTFTFYGQLVSILQGNGAGEYIASIISSTVCHFENSCLRLE